MFQRFTVTAQHSEPLISAAHCDLSTKYAGRLHKSSRSSNAMMLCNRVWPVAIGDDAARRRGCPTAQEWTRTGWLLMVPVFLRRRPSVTPIAYSQK